MREDLIQYYERMILLSGIGIIIISLLPFLMGLFQWRKLNKTLKIYWYFLLVSLLLYLAEPCLIWSIGRSRDFWVPILDACHIKNTNFFRYAYQINNFTLLGWFLYRILLPRPVTVWIKWLSLALIICVTVNTLFIQGPNIAGGFNSTVSALYCFILPLLSMWYLYGQDSKVPLVHNPYFWINIGLIVPNLLGTFLYFAGDDMYKERYTLYAQLTIFKNGVETIAQVLTAIGFFYARNAKYLYSYE